MIITAIIIHGITALFSASKAADDKVTPEGRKSLAAIAIAATLCLTCIVMASILL